MPRMIQVLCRLTCLPFARIAKRYGVLFDRWQQEQLAFRLDAEEIGSCFPVEMELYRQQKRLERFP